MAKRQKEAFNKLSAKYMNFKNIKSQTNDTSFIIRGESCELAEIILRNISDLTISEYYLQAYS